MASIDILHVAGARPNFMKVAPIMAAMEARGESFRQRLVHTGQHYDENMSRVFFDQLGLPRPDINMGVGSGSHARQTARIMEAFERILLDSRPDWVLVVGDVNSTLACSLVCAKLGVPVAHVEAGLRSYDRTMPEEINRVVTDQLADLLLTPSSDCHENLAREGIPAERIRFVGNVMIDTLLRLLPRAKEAGRGLLAQIPCGARAAQRGYALVTLHRPANVDHVAPLSEILGGLSDLAAELPVIFPVHPRTRARLGELAEGSQIDLIDPAGYLEFLGLMDGASVVITDSGGIQEETTVLGVPCLTVRPNTERPITITEGTNRLVECNRAAILAEARAALGEGRSGGSRPELWDGHAAERVVDALLELA